jgi:hypothetical protein
VNTTTKPLFEETLNIVFECFDKYKNKRQLLPIECLKNYQQIYNEDNDTENLQIDDNQVFSERTTTRYSIRDLPSRSYSQRMLPRINTSRTSTTSTTDISINNESNLPTVIETTFNQNIDILIVKETIKPVEVNKTRIIRETFKPVDVNTERPPISKEPFRPIDTSIDRERLAKLKALRDKYTFPIHTRSLEKLHKLSIKRTFSSPNAFGSMQRKKRINLKPILLDKKRQKQKNDIIPICIELDKKENIMIIEENEQEEQFQSVISVSNIEQNENTSVVCDVY